ncbi:hypothetical protein [Rugosimonospora acidiphila]
MDGRELLHVIEAGLVDYRVGSKDRIAEGQPVHCEVDLAPPCSVIR